MESWRHKTPIKCIFERRYEKGYYEIENAAHYILRPWRLKEIGRGLEWFGCTVDRAVNAITQAEKNPNIKRPRNAR